MQPISTSGILTAHPLVGIFGSSYMIVFGAFLWLVPYLMGKPLWSYRLASWTWWLITVGVLTFWLDGFITHYAPLYTLYWPLPADFTQFKPVGGAIFITGIALVMVGTAFFVVNIFKTITLHPGRARAAGRPDAQVGTRLHRAGKPGARQADR